MPKLMSLCEPLVLLASSLITLLLGYLHIPVTAYQQTIAVLMVILLIIYNRVSTSNKIDSRFLSLFMIFITSLFIQLLVISTGALLSPFLILFHLFALASSFLISARSSFSFLVFSLLALAINTYINPEQLEIVKSDPGTILLYLVSFIVIVPLSQIITSKYQFKEELSKILSKKVEVGKTIIESLSELVIVTDVNFRIISINDAVKKNLKVGDEDVINKNFFEFINLRDINGVPITIDQLGIEYVLGKKLPKTTNSLYFYTKIKVAPFRVSIVVRPIMNSEGVVDQLSFVIQQGNDANLEHSTLELAKKNQHFRFEKLKTSLKSTPLATQLIITTELINKAEDDLLLSLELEDHPFEPQIKLIDLALLVNTVIVKKKAFAQMLNLGLKLTLTPEQSQAQSIISLQESSIPSEFLPISGMVVATDHRWSQVLLEKLIDLSILMGSTTANNAVDLFIIQKSSNIIIISIEVMVNNLDFDENQLLSMYYGNMQDKFNLKLGSGLEGYIAQSIIAQLNLPVEVSTNKYQSKLVFQITYRRDAKTN